MPSIGPTAWESILADHVSTPMVTPAMPRLDTSVVLAKWEGRVDEVREAEFIATLSDLSTNQTERAAIGFDELSRSDRALVTPGAVFYWSIGYKDAVSGQRSRESLIRFRRLPQWTKKDRDDAIELAERWKKRLTS